ncbi:peptidase M14 [Alteromonas sp. 5E99-2]|uniref:M14 family zinc carboxypeptidase n=1 Tax=Alteromonas sp. 5E99-2 TaxID=2817683 RepID=UPI001A993197|nr:M14 family zinc carboxypeptidase [Alteromonas sp. 5E99-2]MBO1254786.1 peptidase M14 [Alteromonas sp. 5E99-2]
MAKSLFSQRLKSFLKAFGLIVLFGIANQTFAVVSPHLKTEFPATYYLPTDTKFDPAVPTPEAFLGYGVGKWHIRHDQLVAYMYKLAETSDRVTIEVTGYSHQDKPLLLLTIADPDRKDSVESLRQAHIENIKKQRQPKSDAPLFMYMGYSIHGNEPSGSNAALLLGYYLAAGDDKRIDALLKNTVILLDPALNPDGLSRYSHWANMHKGYQLSRSRYHREHKENWPSARTNYYWFDLNRDWLLLSHPESDARIEQFHHWRPHVLTDFHEMGTDGTYFFQPGVPSRKNPLTSNDNVALTQTLAHYHADAFDKDNQLYFTEEGFDDFYYGKGSTYPDAHGSVGILFEQARVRGHVQESINGDLTFTRSILNHITTSFSTLDGSLENRRALLDYQVSFAEQTKQLVQKDEVAGVLLKQPKDIFRFDAMLDKLDAHQIQYSVVTKDVDVAGLRVEKNKGVFVSYDQAQYRLIKSIFSQRTSFPDNTFYDVSNWNMPLAFDIDYTSLKQSESKKLTLSKKREKLTKIESVRPDVGGVALAFDWYHYQAPALANRLLQKGFKLRIAGKPFTANINGDTRDFESGTVVLPKAFNGDLLEEAFAIAKEFSIPLWSIKSGLTPKGIDLGSRNMVPVRQPRILLIGGEGTSEYEVGEVWHYFDTRVGIPITLIDQEELASVNLSEFSHIVAASGRYREWDERANTSVGKWLENGGTLIGQKSAIRWFESQDWLDASILRTRDIDAQFEEEQLAYADADKLASKKRISGSAYKATVDLSHPLFFGLENNSLPLFKTSNMIVEHTGSPFDTLAVYDDNPLVGGYTSKELTEMISGSAAIIVQRKGRGRVISFVDNVNFRGYWYGTSKLMGNAIFMSNLMD